MAKWRKVEVATWNDGSFRELSQNARMLWLYLLTGPRTTTFPGLIVAREVVIADDLGWSLEAFREAFREVSSKGMAKADWKAGLVVLPKALLDSTGDPRDTSRPESPNVLKSWAKSWSDIPDCGLKYEYLRTLESFAEALAKGTPMYRETFREAFRKALAKGTPHPSPNQEKEQEKEQEQEGEVAPPKADAPKPRARGTGQLHSDHVRCVDHWDKRYRDKYDARPTWNGKTGSLMAGLLKSHHADEICRRMDVLLDGYGPPFLYNGAADFPSFAQHFDKLARPFRAGPAHGQGGLDSQDILALADDLERRGM